MSAREVTALTSGPEKRPEQRSKQRKRWQRGRCASKWAGSKRYMYLESVDIAGLGDDQIGRRKHNAIESTRLSLKILRLFLGESLLPLVVDQVSLTKKNG